MKSFVALLRGVNVGGHNKVAMADLRNLFTALGFTNVRTYIQSGNIVFGADTSDAAALAETIRLGISRELKVDCGVIVRDAAELSAVIDGNPYEDEDVDESKLGVIFLADEPSPAQAERLVVPEGMPERIVVSGRHLYVLYPNGMGRSKLDQSFFRKRLPNTTTTTRNLRTVRRLHDMLMADT
ncbi:DUF1697 domain-containing protein [Stackebrandtia soli]|uniref:DUF1697 domain-containing protein n=1 Tax=Stackebrandtia soli TaxID=1892856 RepID=UPI0039EA71B0